MAASQAKRWANELTPPIVWRGIRKMRAARSPKPASEPRRGGVETEYGADWYDEKFLSDNGEHYRRPYWETNWYGALSVVGDRIAQMPDPRVLDMGCGPSPLGQLLRDRGVKHYVGFDFSTARLEFAASRLPEYRFELADVYTTDLFETVDYNVVVGTEFLEHLDRDVFVLDRIPAGKRVICNVPNYWSGSHVRRFTSEDEVRERYGSRFDEFRCDRVPNTTGSSEYVFDGCKKAGTGTPEPGDVAS